MINRNSASAWVTAAFFLLIFTGCGYKNSESRALNDFANSKNRGMKYLQFYPSTVRMLAKVLGDTLATSLKDIRGGRLFFSVESTNNEASANKFVALKSALQNDGFESLVHLRSNGMDLDISILDREMPIYVVFVKEGAKEYIVELSGKLSYESLRALSSLDFKRATSIFSMIPQSQNAEGLADSLSQKEPI